MTPRQVSEEASYFFLPLVPCTLPLKCPELFRECVVRRLARVGG